MIVTVPKTKVPDGSTLIFEIPEFSSDTTQTKTQMDRFSELDPFIRFGAIQAYNERADRHRAIACIPRYSVAPRRY